MQCARNRRALQSMPFETEEPDHWASTYQRSHLNFLPATTQDAADHAFKAELPTRVYKRPMNDDLAAMMSMHGPQPTNHGLSFRERDAAMKVLRACGVGWGGVGWCAKGTITKWQWGSISAPGIFF